MSPVASLRFLLAAAAFFSAPGLVQAAELAPGQVLIALRADVVATGQTARLGDIANIRTTDLAAIRRLVDLPVGRAPAVGTQAVVRQQDLARWVRRNTGWGVGKVVWAGSGETRVRSLAADLAGVRIEAVARDALRHWLEPRTTSFHADVVTSPRDLTIPAGRVALKGRTLPDGDPSPRAVVWVDVAVDDRFVRTVPVTFAVEAYRQMRVAPQAVAAGVPLSLAHLETMAVAAGRASGRPAFDDGAVLHTAKPLRAGQVVTGADVKQVAAVERGAWVRLQYQAGAIALEGRAQALQEGRLGQVVQVRSAGSEGAVQARVLAAGLVEAVQ